MNSLERLIKILDIFEESPGIFSAEQLHGRLGYTRSTLYRYLKTLVDAGLLTSLHGSGFTLGPRVIELNALMVSRDPLILAARPYLAALAGQFRGNALLCRRFRDKALYIHQETAGSGGALGYGVGIPMSLVFGSAGRVILANLQSGQVRRLYEKAPATFLEAGLGVDLLAVRRSLRRIRERGVEVYAGEMDPAYTGFAAPIFDGGANIVGALTVTLAEEGLSQARTAAVTLEVMAAAAAVTQVVAGESVMADAQSAVPKRREPLPA